MSRITLKGVGVTFGDEWAVNSLTLEIAQGEFFGLLGPSGCGKTTTLRTVAGFLTPTTGTVFFGDTDVTKLPPERRNIGMVFQSYALFPHMSVEENVAFGLVARKVSKAEIKGRVEDALSLVGLSDLGKRPVTDLSGGQQQRVALTRAIVVEPDVLLLDEPLSNLDAKLRARTGSEIRALQQRLGITTLYVTHDQEEAMTLCDRFALLDGGMLQQVGTPQHVYAKPANRFVADFLGGANLMEIESVKEVDGSYLAICQGVPLVLKAKPPEGEKSLSIRPHQIGLYSEPTSEVNEIEGTIVDYHFTGADIELEVDTHIRRFRVRIRESEKITPPAKGAKVFLSMPPEHLWPLT